MKRILAIIIFAASLFMLNGCAIHGGYAGHSIITSVELSQANYKVVERVSGSVMSVKIMGFGLANEKMYNDAYAQMVENAKLTGGAKALANITTDVQQAKFIFWSRKTVTVSASVIEFTK